MWAGMKVVQTVAKWDYKMVDVRVGMTAGQLVGSMDGEMVAKLVTRMAEQREDKWAVLMVDVTV